MGGIKDYFAFNRKERRGILILIFILLILIAWRYNLGLQGPVAVEPDRELEAEVQAFEASGREKKKSTTKQKQLNEAYADKELKLAELNLHMFNPNKISKENWEQMGLPAYLINTIHNYLDKGGRFHKKEDLKKIYGLSDELYAILEPYIEIPKEKWKKEQKIPVKSDSVKKDTLKYKHSKWKPILVDVNSADTVQMMRLKGVGVYYARRILKYREMLGGFISKAQFLEVYGIDSSRYTQFEEQLNINPMLLRKVNINKAPVKELKKHPYLDYYVAKSIVDRRIIHGEYTDLAQIRNIDLIHEDLYNRIIPYLSIDDSLKNSIQ